VNLIKLAQTSTFRVTESRVTTFAQTLTRLLNATFEPETGFTGLCKAFPSLFADRFLPSAFLKGSLRELGFV